MFYGLLQGMLLLLGARGVAVMTCVRHMCYYYYRDRVYVWLLGVSAVAA